jgi:hypothetical protein
MATLILVRFYLIESDVQEGEVAIDKIGKLIDRLAILNEKSIKEYWKIPEYLEVSAKFDFKDESDLDMKFLEVVSLLGNGWIFSNNIDDKSAVWNLGVENNFCVPKTQWAIVEI